MTIPFCASFAIAMAKRLKVGVVELFSPFLGLLYYRAEFREAAAIFHVNN
jgi:hypothetical protein